MIVFLAIGIKKQDIAFSLQCPEALHQMTILFSDRGIPDGYRFMDGFGNHTYSLWNKNGDRFWIKFLFKFMQGKKNLTPEKDAETFKFNPFDLTKVWSHKDFPLIEVGMMEPNQNPKNYFAEVEQSAFLENK